MNMIAGSQFSFEDNGGVDDDCPLWHAEKRRVLLLAQREIILTLLDDNLYWVVPLLSLDNLNLHPRSY